MLKNFCSIYKISIFYPTILISWLIGHPISASANPVNPIPSQIIPGEIINSPNIYNQQNSILPLNNDLLSTLTIQSCSSGCLFFNAKNTSSSFIGNSTEITIGSVWQLGSPDSGRKELMRISSEAALIDAQIRQKHHNESIITDLRRELVDAISARKITGAILIARQLAPKLGYKDHLQLLNELGLSQLEIDRNIIPNR